MGSDLQLLYWTQHVAVAASLAAMAITGRLPVFRLSLVPRAYFAIAVTPFVLALSTLLIGLVAGREYRLAFFLVPLGLAVVSLVIAGPEAVRMVIATGARTARSSVVSFIAGIVLVIAVGWAGWVWANEPLVAHDASVYLTEARGFADDPSLGSIPTYESPPGMIVRTHPHSFLYQAYLAQAAMSMGPELNSDAVTPKLVTGLTYVYLALAVWALAAVVAPSWIAPLSAGVMLANPVMEFYVAAHSRDGFRMIPIMALLAGIVVIAGARHRPGLPALAGIAALTGFAVAGHTINIVYLAAIWIALLLLVLSRLLKSRTFVLLSVAAAAGATLPSLDYIRSVIQYGSPLGRGMNYLYYAGTPLQTWFESEGHWMKQTGLLHGLSIYFERYGAGLTLATVLAAAVSGLFYARLTSQRWIRLGLAFLALLFVPLLLSYGSVSVKGAVLSNQRYAGGIFFIGAVLIVVAASHWIKQGARWLGAARSERGRVILALATSLLVVHLSLQILWKWSQKLDRSWLDARESQNREVAHQVRDRLLTGGRWLTDNYAIAYHVRPVPVFLFSNQGGALLRAKNIEEATQLITSLKLCVVALTRPTKEQAATGWMSELPMIRSLLSVPDETVIEIGRWIVYPVHPTLYVRTGVENPCRNAEAASRS